MKKLSPSFLLLFLILIPVVTAHQPRLVINVKNSEENPIIIEDPEISKTYYSKLIGNPDYYRIISNKPFSLYLNVLIPDIPVENKMTFSVKVTDSMKKQILFLNGTNYTWKEFFEPFGGDSYLQGTEARLNVTAGTYNIKVFNSDNTGKYSLAVGEIESFPPNEFLNTIFVLPLIKQQFFNKPMYTGLLNYIGLFVLILIIVVIVIVVVIFKVFKKFRKKRKPI